MRFMPDMRICPACDCSLETKTFDDLSVDACPKCAGIFFDAGEIVEARKEGFEHLEQAVFPSEPHTPKANGARPCPKCRTTMTSYRYQYHSPIFLDCCPSCDGIWVDDGELHQMAEFCKQAQCNDTAVAQSTAMIEVAQLDAATQANLDRASKIRRLFGILSRPVYGYRSW